MAGMLKTMGWMIKRICLQKPTPLLQNTPGKSSDKEVLRESQMTIPETPSPDQSSEPMSAGKKKDHGNHAEPGMRKQHMLIMPGNTNFLDLHQQNGNLFGGANDHASRTGSAYSEVCGACKRPRFFGINLFASQHFARIREVLIVRSLLSTLNSGFLTPCRDRLMVALGLDLFALNDERFMDMFVVPGAVDVLRNERESLQKRQKILQSCLTEFKNVARAL
ncbi:hypothetical protein EJ110_NYTH07314 [Nymphaea thermarum]|nr:hypothetical protein EJ110_NYTH07314 [Nymphaea thermarum]